LKRKISKKCLTCFSVLGKGTIVKKDDDLDQHSQESKGEGPRTPKTKIRVVEDLPIIAKHSFLEAKQGRHKKEVSGFSVKLF